MVHRFRSYSEQRYLPHYLLIVILLVLTLIVHFDTAFLKKIPAQQLDYSAVAFRNCFYNNSDLINQESIWQQAIYSGMPWFHAQKSLEMPYFRAVLRFVSLLTPPGILLLFVSCLGIYLFLAFLKLPHLLCFTGALLFLFSPLLLSYLNQGESVTLLIVSLFPWLALSLHYLKVRRNLLGMAMLAATLSLILKQSQVVLSLGLMVIIFIYWLVILLGRNQINARRAFLKFSLLLFLAVSLAAVSISYPALQWLRLYPHLQINFPITQLLVLLYALINLLAVLVVAGGMKMVLDNWKKDNEEFFRIIRRFLIIILIILLLLIAVKFAYELVDIPVIILAALGLLTGYSLFAILLESDRLPSRAFLFLTAIFTLLLLLVLNGSNLRSPKIRIEDHQQPLPNRIDEYLQQDEELFRIYPMGREFNQNHWGIFNETIGGNCHLILKRYQHIIKGCLGAELQNRVPINWNIVNMLNVKYLIFYEKLSLPQLSFGSHDLHTKLTVYRNEHWLPRAWFVGSWECPADTQKLLRRLNHPDFHPETAVLVEQDIGEIACDPAGQIDFLSWQPDEIVITLETEVRSFLVLSEIFYPDSGWKAYLDGSEIEILAANYILKGFIIPPGRHNLELHFAPADLIYSLYLNLVGLGLILIFLLFGLYAYIRSNYRGEIVYVLQE